MDDTTWAAQSFLGFTCTHIRAQIAELTCIFFKTSSDNCCQPEQRIHHSPYLASETCLGFIHLVQSSQLTQVLHFSIQTEPSECTSVFSLFNTISRSCCHKKHTGTFAGIRARCLYHAVLHSLHCETPSSFIILTEISRDAFLLEAV